MIEVLKKEINKVLKEIEEKAGKKVDKISKSLK